MSQQLKTPQSAFVVLAMASLLWGLAWLPLKYMEELGFSGVPITLFVYLVMFVVFIPFVYKFRAEIIKSWPVLLGVALFGGGAQLAFNTSMIYGDVIRTMVLFYMVPLWGVIGGRIFLGEKITPLRWFGMGLSVVGAFLVVGGMNAFVSPPSWLDALALLSGFLFAMNNIVFRASPKVPVMLMLPFMFLGSVLLAFLVVIQQQEVLIPNVSVNAWLVLLGYGAIWMVLANLGTQWAVTKMESGKSSIILILELITAVVSASIILGETLQGLELLGGGFILFAAFLETRSQENETESLPQNGAESHQ
ncbi:hypothetical protein JCM30760_17460 [Thiomicrorhabdus hydrogeniphila]